MKTCRKCGETKALDGFYAHPAGLEGVAEKCKECHKTAMRKNRAAKVDYYRKYDQQRFQNDPRVKKRHERYRATDAGKTAMNRSRQKWDKNNKHKRAAHIILGNAVRNGKVLKPNKCEQCGAKPNRIEGHHSDYAKPLDVTWLCRKCHVEAHK